MQMDVDTLYRISLIILDVFSIWFLVWIPALIIWLILICVKDFKKYKKLGKWLVWILPVCFLFWTWTELFCYLYFNKIGYVDPNDIPDSIIDCLPWEWCGID